MSNQYGLSVCGVVAFMISGEGSKWYARPTNWLRENFAALGNTGKQPSHRMVDTEAEAVAAALRFGEHYKAHKALSQLTAADVQKVDAPTGERGGSKGNVVAKNLAASFLKPAAAAPAAAPTSVPPEAKTKKTGKTK
jgi:hypothetical protein